MFKLITGVVVLIAIMVTGTMIYQRYMPGSPVPADFGSALDSLGDKVSGFVASAAAYLDGENQQSGELGVDTDSSAIAEVEVTADSLAGNAPPAGAHTPAVEPVTSDSVVVARRHVRETHYKVFDILEGR